MRAFFHIILTQPLFNGLILLYEYVTFGDLGLAIIFLTIIIRVLLFPLFYKGFKNQALMQKLQPEITRLHEEHKHDKEKQTMALLELYKKHNLNPFASLILLILQIPILIALYRVFLSGFGPETLIGLYNFVPHPATIVKHFLGIIDLSQRNLVLVVLAAIAQYIQSVLTLPRGGGDQQNQAQQMAKTMVWLGPALTLLVLSSLPAAVGLYWLTSSLFSIGQQWYINKSIYGEPSNDSKDNIGANGVQ